MAGQAAGGKSLGEHIVDALPHLTVVGWTTITEDKAASAFSRGFYDGASEVTEGVVGASRAVLAPRRTPAVVPLLPLPRLPLRLWRRLRLRLAPSCFV